MSVSPSAWNKQVPSRRIFVKFDVWRLFGKFGMKIRMFLKCDKNYWFCTCRPTCGDVWWWDSECEKYCRQKLKTKLKITFYNRNFFNKIEPFMRNCEIMWQGQTDDRNRLITGTDRWQGLTDYRDRQMTGTDWWQGQTDDRDRLMTGTDWWQGQTDDRDRQMTGTDWWQWQSDDRDRLVTIRTVWEAGVLIAG